MANRCDFGHEYDHLTDMCVSCGISGEEIHNRRHAAKAQTVEGRPIQAGDWAECLPRGGGLFLKDGDRYQVERVLVGDRLKLVGLQHDFDLFRFKRVDGPHPVEVGCVDYGFRLGAYSVTGRRSGKHAAMAALAKEHEATILSPKSPELVDTNRACDSCQAPAASPTARFCVYCEHRGADKDAINDEELELRNEPARARNEAALRREAERPRLTADARELAKPHPWEEFE